MSSYRPVIMGTRHAVAAGHYLAAEAGFDVLNSGGNAIDAGVAAGLAIGVLQSDIVNVAGVAPILLWIAEERKVINIDGLGTWPSALPPDYFQREHGGAIPEGILRTVMPAAPAAWLWALERYGTMSFADVAQYAIRFARDGFPMYPLLQENIVLDEEKYRRWPSSAEVYLPDDRVPEVGDIFVQAELAKSLQYMADEEARARGAREAGIRAARDAFYKGDIARHIAQYHADNGGFVTYEDLARYDVQIEPTVATRFGDIELHCCGPWTQGPLLSQTLRLLESHDLASLGHNSPAYIHLLTEALKLACADRERYYGDPNFVDVPMTALLSDDYTALRRALIREDEAWPEMPPPGHPASGAATVVPGPAIPPPAPPPSDIREPATLDTSYVCAVDSQGNAISATPSDVSRSTPIIPGTGLCPSSRGSQSWGDPAHPSSARAGKRPRLTPNPVMALKNGKPYMMFGTPGGDVQSQAMLQVLLNRTVFGMDIQSAIEAPRFATFSYPSSFEPHSYFPGRLNLESRIPRETGETLGGLGHKVEWWPDMIWRAAAVCAICVDDEKKVLHAGADPRRPAYALGW
ncbi:MAG: gamma-glutamyltransferase [Alphaproteobacteria bacterium]|nr:gamma-glutamyltransferase [Alphaproteobacteria bacterium]